MKVKVKRRPVQTLTGELEARAATDELTLPVTSGGRRDHRGLC
jgi:hypothetical protein